MFKSVSSQVKYPELEESVLKFWKDNDTYKESLKLRENAERYVFFEGPPTANGRPGIHHVLARVFKDLFPRYQTMKGKYSLRVSGWDTHGLPVELEVEKKIGSTGKQDIEKFGIAEFNRLCKQSVWDYMQEWIKLTDRIGFWVDHERGYITYENKYIESGWWILKSLWDRGLLFKDYKVTMHCPRCSTSLADHEVALGFKDDVDDPSVYVKFKVADGAYAGAYLLAYTTTPWTLPANVALALKGDADYALVSVGTGVGAGSEPAPTPAPTPTPNERYLCAAARVHDLFGDKATILQTMRGDNLVGARYENLFTGVASKGDTPDLARAYHVIADETASVEEGTGMVHIAPAYGDLEVGRRHGLPTLFSVDLNGKLMNELGTELGAGKFFKEADKDIARNLRQRGLLLKEGRTKHAYPFCWRCDSPLLYYAKSSWYIKTTAVKERLLSSNNEVTWYPGHIQKGRFGNWLENNVDWAISRERYWGTPLPIWQCASCGEYACVGSVAEMKSHAVDAHAVNWDELDLHRPWVDGIVLKCHQCGGAMHRLPDVLDCWFDSGAMPYAQWHYPFENQDMFEDQFPADFICEAIDQTRGWFYSLHALGVLMKDTPVYKNCLVLGHILDEKGNKMSKSRGNVVDPWHVLNHYGADALRWYLFRTTSTGNPYRFSERALMSEVVSGMFNTLWNTYSFFVTYANIDQWKPNQGNKETTKQGNKQAQTSLSPLDTWVLSELQVLVKEVDDALTQYDVATAARAVETFVENLSNWYVRRSRRRFWKTQADADKRAAYATLYECLVTVAKLMAPFAPFLAEELYQNLVLSVDDAAPKSVHHCDFPTADLSRVDETLMRDTRLVMRLASLGLAARKRAALKVRQPLAEAMVVIPNANEREAMRALSDQLAEEWNVKAVQFADAQSGVADLALNPLPMKLGPKFGKNFPVVRKALMDNPAAYAGALQSGQNVAVEVNGAWFEVTPDEVEVKLTPRAGWTVSNDASYAVALSTQLTESLKREGLARELVRQYNDLRKTANFRVEDLMHATWQGDSVWAQVVAEFGDYIQKETLAVELMQGDVPDGATTAMLEVEEGSVVLSVRAAGRTVKEAGKQENKETGKKAVAPKKVAAQKTIMKKVTVKKLAKTTRAATKKTAVKKQVDAKKKVVVKKKSIAQKATAKTTATKKKVAKKKK